MNIERLNCHKGAADLSVVMPVFNHADSVCNALDAVARQKLKVEVVLIDDCSTDGSVEQVKAWSGQHREVPLVMARLPEKSFALGARLAGIEIASAPDIVFMDADDVWLGESLLASALERKRAFRCELAHFRTIGVDFDGQKLGELLWTSPPSMDILYGKDIFSAYASMQYIPLLLWNKIYSKALLLRALPYARGQHIYYFDDKFFVSIILMVSQSYIGCDEYIYQYNLPGAWPMEKYAKCIHDLLALRDNAIQLFKHFEIPDEACKNFLDFIRRRMTIHCGNLCDLQEVELWHGQSPDKLLADVMLWLPPENFFSVLAGGARINAAKIMKVLERMNDNC